MDTKASPHFPDQVIPCSAGAGEMRIRNQQGQLIDSDTIKAGNESWRRDRK
jgi:predicted DNA binding protein